MLMDQEWNFFGTVTQKNTSPWHTETQLPQFFKSQYRNSQVGNPDWNSLSPFTSSHPPYPIYPRVVSTFFPLLAFQLYFSPGHVNLFIVIYVCTTLNLSINLYKLCMIPLLPISRFVSAFISVRYVQLCTQVPIYVFVSSWQGKTKVSYLS